MNIASQVADAKGRAGFRKLWASLAALASSQLARFGQDRPSL